MGCLVCLRTLPVQRAVWTVAVIVQPPFLEDAPGFGQENENMLIETLIPQPAIETFHETVIRRLPWAAVLQAHSMFLHPFVQCPTDELRAVVRPKPARHAPLQAKAFRTCAPR